MLADKKQLTTQFLLLIFLIAAQAAVGQSRSVTLSNVLPRRDRSGTVLDVHDGCLEYFNGAFYLYGTRYGDTDGFTPANRYVCYRSPDLLQWQYEGELLQNPPKGVYYRPYVKFNPKTKKYVLWYNWYPTLWEGQYGVAVADDPAGPFVIQNPCVQVAFAQPGDHGLFIDDDDAAYLIYTSIAEGHGISIEKLSEDYLSSTLKNSGIIEKGVEACALFKRNGLYYALFDRTCCFCPEGTGARVYTGVSPFGPFEYRGNINRIDDRIIIPAQQTHVAAVPSAAGVQFIWMGDMWGSTTDGIKGHDFQYWSSPLQFDADGMIAPLVWENTIVVQLP